MLPSDFPITATVAAPLAASSARSAWPRIHSNGSSGGRRALVHLDDRPSVRLSRLAGEPEQRRLAEVADPGQEDRAAVRVTLVPDHEATLAP